MNPRTRAAVAFIAGRASGGGSRSSIYDYTEGGYRTFSGRVADTVAIFDHTDGCHIGGPKSNFYHYGNSAHISFSLDGKRFSGFDYASSSHFSGTVNGSNISLYDYGVSKYFQFHLG